MAHNTTNVPFVDELPKLLKARGLTLRALSREIGGFDHGYLSRMLNGKIAVNVHHVERIAAHLGLPEGYFPETREARVIEAVQKSPRLRDQIYARLPRRRPRS